MEKELSNDIIIIRVSFTHIFGFNESTRESLDYYPLLDKLPPSPISTPNTALPAPRPRHSSHLPFYLSWSLTCNAPIIHVQLMFVERIILLLTQHFCPKIS